MVKNLPANARDRRCGFYPWVRKIPWRRAWQPTPVSLPRKSHGQGSLVGNSPWGCKDYGMTKYANTHTLTHTHTNTHKHQLYFLPFLKPTLLFWLSIPTARVVQASATSCPGSVRLPVGRPSFALLCNLIAWYLEEFSFLYLLPTGLCYALQSFEE